MYGNASELFVESFHSSITFNVVLTNKLNFMRKIFFIFLVACSFIQLHAQEEYTLSGYLKDASTGEELLYATVAVKGTTIGANTNLYGFYSLTLPAGTYDIIYSYIGYQSKTEQVILDKNITLDVEIDTEANQLDEIVVTADAEEDENIRNTEVSVVTLDVAKSTKIPVLLGEKDVFKTLQLLPGVASNSEGGSGFFVRGGATDQNLVLLDEAPVYNASHLLGFFSVFNSDALKDVKLYKGGIPAQYGGRASSVMDIRMKNGNMREWQASGGIGLISSRATIEGPIVKDKGSIIVSGRRTYADVVGRLFTDALDGTSLFFYDLNAKANYKVTDKDRIYISSYFGRDALGIENFGFDWGNQTFTSRWNRTINEKLFVNTSVIYSDYNYGFDISAGEIEIDLSAGIFDYTLKQDFNYYPNPNNKVSFGWISNLHRFKPVNFVFNNTEDDNIEFQNALESGLYAGNEQKINSRLSLNYGLRFSIFNNIGPYTEKVYDDENNVIEETSYEEFDFYHTYTGLEPRLSSTYLLNEKSSIKFSYNRNFQYLQLLENSNSGSPTDVWIPSSPFVAPTIADQVAIGFFRNFNNNTYRFSTELYYKTLQNTVDYEDGAEIFGNSDLEAELIFGEGRAAGAEILLEKTKGKLTGWVSYTLSRVRNRADEINNGDWYSARQDRTHDLSIVAIYELTPKINFSGSWVYYTGDAVTFPAGKYFIDGTLVNLYTERNADRLPDYHRLDLGFTWIMKDSKKFYSDLNVSVYNAYNRKNAFTITFDENDAGQTEATRLALFGTIPSITWNFRF